MRGLLGGNRRSNRNDWARIVAAAEIAMLGLFTGAPAAHAVDGVIEINTARVVAGDVSSGDDPGYPATITDAGSYRLTGNLTVPGGTGAANIDGIQILADDVTLDLNGFSIACRRNTLPASPCTLSGTGRGIVLNGDNVRVENGTIRDFAGDGLLADVSANYVLDGIHSRNHGGSGLQALADSHGQVFRSVFLGNQTAGLRFNSGASYLLEAVRSGRNVSFGLQGLGASHGQVLRCHFHDNQSAGLSIASTSSALVLDSMTEGNSEAIFAPSFLFGLRVGHSMLRDGQAAPPLDFGLIACIDSGGTRHCP